MGLALGIFVFVSTLASCFVVSVAHADGQPDVWPWGWFIAGTVVAGLLVLSHTFPPRW